jgi:hypothetical protein
LSARFDRQRVSHVLPTPGVSEKLHLKWGERRTCFSGRTTVSVFPKRLLLQRFVLARLIPGMDTTKRTTERQGSFDWLGRVADLVACRMRCRGAIEIIAAATVLLSACRSEDPWRRPRVPKARTGLLAQDRPAFGSTRVVVEGLVDKPGACFLREVPGGFSLRDRP